MRLPEYYSTETAQPLSNTAVVQKRAVRDPGNVALIMKNRAILGGEQRNRVRTQYDNARKEAIGSAIYSTAMLVAAAAGYAAAGASSAGAAGAAGAPEAAGASGAPQMGTLSSAELATINAADSAALEMFGGGEEALKVKSGFGTKIEGMKNRVSEAFTATKEKIGSFLGDEPSMLKAVGREAFPGIANAYDRGFRFGESRTQAEQLAGKRFFMQNQMNVNSAVGNMLSTGKIEEYDEKYREIKDALFADAKSELSPGAYAAFEDVALGFFNGKHEQIVNAAAQGIYQEHVAMYNSDLTEAVTAGDPDIVEEVINRGLYGDPNVPEEQRIPLLSPAAADRARKAAAQGVFENGLIGTLNEKTPGMAIMTLLKTENGEYAFGGKHEIEWTVNNEDGSQTTHIMEVGLSEEQRKKLVGDYEIKQKMRDQQVERASEYKVNDFFDRLPAFVEGGEDFYEWMTESKDTLLGRDEDEVRRAFAAATKQKEEDVNKKLSESYAAALVVRLNRESMDANVAVETVTRAIESNNIGYKEGLDIIKLYTDKAAAQQLNDIDRQIEASFKDKDGLVMQDLVSDAYTMFNDYYRSDAYRNDTDAERQMAISNIISEVKNRGEKESAEEILVSALARTNQVFAPDRNILIDQNKRLEEGYKKALAGGYAGLETTLARPLGLLREKANQFVKEHGDNLSYSREVAAIPVYKDANGNEYIMDIQPSRGIGYEPKMISIEEGREKYAVLREKKIPIGDIIYPPAVGDDKVQAAPLIYLQSGYVSLSENEMEILATPSAEESSQGWRIIQPKIEDNYYKINFSTGQVVQFNNVNDLNSYIYRAGGQYDFGEGLVTIRDLDMLRSASEHMRAAAREKK